MQGARCQLSCGKLQTVLNLGFEKLEFVSNLEFWA